MKKSCLIANSYRRIAAAIFLTGGLAFSMPAFSESACDAIRAEVNHNFMMYDTAVTMCSYSSSSLLCWDAVTIRLKMLEDSLAELGACEE
ncbi:MAG TPA: hypothetical protein VGN04_11085 [Herbaspirillum sp.]|jgi:hypothetical protein